MDNAKKQIRRKPDEWLSLITECRRSGLSDHEWCRNNNISLSTFYKAQSRLREMACEIPSNDGTVKTSSPQEVVMIGIEKPPILPKSSVDGFDAPVSVGTGSDKTMEIRINGIQLNISNDVSTVLLAEVLRLLGGRYAG